MVTAEAAVARRVATEEGGVPWMVHVLFCDGQYFHRPMIIDLVQTSAAVNIPPRHAHIRQQQVSPQPRQSRV